ncbi:MAG: hypothetical protein WBG30_01115 [Psychrilyobacter sp.]|uniref:hypothetical protein n=1 Tax=Psychrilyobacter sp. TaxID=2586924 RepID=UPI003C74AB33
MKKILLILSILCFGALSFGNEIHTLDKSYTGDEIKSLSLELVNGDIHIIPSKDNNFKIEMISKDEISYIENKNSKSHEYNIEIKSLKEKTWLNSEGKIDIILSIPTNNINNNISIETVNSKIDISSVKADIEIELVNGEINIKNLDGIFSAETVNVDISGININKIGDIETVRGSIILDGNEFLESSHLETVVGSIDLNINKIAGRNNITTVIGGVSLNTKNTKKIIKYDDVYNLDGKKIVIETVIGKIKVNK